MKSFRRYLIIEALAVVAALILWANYASQGPSETPYKFITNLFEIAFILVILTALIWIIARFFGEGGGHYSVLPSPTQFGDARPATLGELEEKTHLLDGKDGIPLGYMLDREQDGTQRWRKLQYSGGRHLITVAPAGTGKGTTAIIPTLLEYDASCFVIDPKGELAAVTARQRQRMGHEVIILNPFYEMQDQFALRGFPKPHRFNPLAALDPRGRNFVSEAARLAEALVYNQSKDPHWSDSARNLVNCLILHVCTEPGEVRSLARVRQLLGTDLVRTIATMAESSYQPLRQKAGRFREVTNEIKSITSTATTQTDFLDDPSIAESVGGDDFRFSDLARRKMTVYLILPPGNMGDYARWLRMLLTEALNRMMEEKGHKPVLFLLEEFATLGELPVIERAMGLVRGYGIQIWPILQDLNQVKDIYGDRWETFLANAEVTQFFTPNDETTANYISNRCGVKTIYTQSLNISEISKAQARGGFTGQSSSTSPQQRPMIYPYELYGLYHNRQITFHANMKYPLFPFRFPYYGAFSIPGGTDYAELYDPNPYVLHQRGRPARLGGPRASNDNSGGQRQSSNGRMTRAQALKLFELKEGATPDQINAAWRRLVERNHPDKGGSTEITKLLNEARAVLLGS